jgi:hypothetical protein
MRDLPMRDLPIMERRSAQSLGALEGPWKSERLADVRRPAFRDRPHFKPGPGGGYIRRPRDFPGTSYATTGPERKREAVAAL